MNILTAIALAGEKKARASIKIVAAIFEVSPDDLVAPSVMQCEDFIAVVVHRKVDLNAKFVDKRIVQSVLWRDNPTRIEVNLGS